MRKEKLALEKKLRQIEKLKSLDRLNREEKEKVEKEEEFRVHLESILLKIKGL